jgi:hypothetical protein
VCRVFRSYSTLSLLFVFSLSGYAKAPSLKKTDPNLTMTLCVYNLAEIPIETLHLAEQEASRIFRRAGVEVDWLDYSLSPGQVMNHPCCQPPFGEADFRLRILPRFKAELLGVSRTSLGLALPCAPGEGGCIVNVFYHRAQELAHQGGLQVPKMLGHAIAHEIGHELLHSNAHSPVGLMQAKWGPKELQKAAKGDLLFTHEEANVIRDNVLAKIKQREPVDASGTGPLKQILLIEPAKPFNLRPLIPWMTPALAQRKFSTSMMSLLSCSSSAQRIHRPSGEMVRPGLPYATGGLSRETTRVTCPVAKLNNSIAGW